MDSLKNHFLIAMPALEDSNFFHSVTLICEHNEEGAMGIVVNHPLQVTQRELFEHLNIPAGDENEKLPVMAGGPVQPERGFVIHNNSGNWQSSLSISNDIAITTSEDILQAMARNEGPDNAFVALGYAGWSAGQLEQELADNAWLSVAASPEILFQTPVDNRWNAAAQLLGVDIQQVSSDLGHA